MTETMVATLKFGKTCFKTLIPNKLLSGTHDLSKNVVDSLIFPFPLRAFSGNRFSHATANFILKINDSTKRIPSGNWVIAENFIVYTHTKGGEGAREFSTLDTTLTDFRSVYPNAFLGKDAPEFLLPPLYTLRGSLTNYSPRYFIPQA